MHLIICNERLLFRFGVDRVLLLLAQGFKAAGWRITLITQRADHGVLRGISDDIHILPSAAAPYSDLDRRSAAWLQENRHLLLPPGLAPAGTVALLGGWPFYSAIALFREWGVVPVALDCGGVPYGDMQGQARRTQELLRTRRREYFPEARAITPISDFIARTQSRPDAGPSGEAEIVTIRLGADHLAASAPTLWQHGTADAGSDPLAEAPQIINLGRWEIGNYKNSEALFELARTLLLIHPGLRFGVLASEAELQVPQDLIGSIVPLGHPSDTKLAHFMSKAQLGVSVSRWEGFNLPLAEMQHLGRPVLVLDLGAHPEVVATPDQLCRDEGELAAKAAQVLEGALLSGPEWEQALARFRDTFTWQRTIEAYLQLCSRLTPVPAPKLPRVVVDASACLRDPANTGVARVVRSLCRKLQDFGEPLFVSWDEDQGEYVLPTEAQYQRLGAYGGPEANPAHYRLPRSEPGLRLSLAALAGRHLAGGWLLQGEIVFEEQGPQRRAAARRLGLKVAAIFYDAIPVTHPQWVLDQRIRDNHAAYMRGLAECDQVLAISDFSADQLRSYWQQQGIGPRAPVRTCWIPGELSGVPRAVSPPPPPRADQPLRLFCVSTLEPRKNHQTLLAALALLSREQPQLDWRLDLVGNRYAGAAQLAEAVEQAAAADQRIVWHGVVDDDTLNRLHGEAHLGIYPSLVEGFGMPILESLWHGRPCLCHHESVMAELAAGGGCQTLDMHNPAALASAIVELASQPQRYRTLAEQAVTRPILTWRGYCRTLLQQLASHDARPAAVSAPLPRQWQHLLVPAGQELLDDPAQLALAALLLTRPQPCALLLGEQPDWLLTLVGHYVPQAWQLLAGRCDGSVARRGAVSRIDAQPTEALPLLATALTRQGIEQALLVLSAELAEQPDAQRAIADLAEHGLSCLLLLPTATGQPLLQALGAPAPSISLPGYQSYRLDAPEARG
ncbi:glycosyltransferase family 4 protein [Stutzerimonas nitrititolerans]|uniref:glycosyltransferase family 4 protein n=1 Tax=Stutzerimonas nitrititolerans TaxID=2482751 RepID=UPI0028AFDEAF|nr:glycosyltransferase [Stutzerimonas nitrititolerans]